MRFKNYEFLLNEENEGETLLEKLNFSPFTLTGMEGWKYSCSRRQPNIIKGAQTKVGPYRASMWSKARAHNPVLHRFGRAQGAVWVQRSQKFTEMASRELQEPKFQTHWK